MTRGAPIGLLVATSVLGCASEESTEPVCEPVDLVVRDGLSRSGLATCVGRWLHNVSPSGRKSERLRPILLLSEFLFHFDG